MSEDQHLPVLMEIRDLLREQAVNHQAEIAANREFRKSAFEGQEAAIRAQQATMRQYKNMLRVFLFLIALIAVLGFYAMTVELKRSLREVIEPPADQAEIVKKLFQPPTNPLPASPPSKSDSSESP